MALKLKKDHSYTYTDKQQEKENDKRKKSVFMDDPLDEALIYFVTHCLSCISLEARSRASHGNPVTKSAVFNALFRRTYNLRIVVLVTNVITGVITTLMMTLGDRYGIPYLYLPWLLNTMKGMALCEGPALLSLANVLLSNVTHPTVAFMLLTFLLYVEEICIWNSMFVRFQQCWKNYHNKKRCETEKDKEQLFAAHNKKLICQGNTKNEFNIGVEKSKSAQKPDEFCVNNINSQISTDTRFRSVKSSIGNNSNFTRNQLPDLTG